MNKSFSKKINDNQKKIILKYMKNHIKDNQNQNIEYFFKTKKYAISIYKNNSILIQGESFENILKLINVDANSILINKNVKYNKEPINNEINNEIKIGTDESGVGDLFGGIVVSAVKIPKENLKELRKIKIDDSKKLDDRYMKNIYKKIINLVEYSIVSIKPIEYNNLYSKYNNSNIIKTFGHNEAIKKIYKNNDYVIIDQFANEENYKKYINKLNEEINYNFILETKAESKYLEVACASIIARVNFLNQIEEIERKNNIKIPLGANPKNVNNLLELIKNNKMNKKSLIKIHFKNNKE